MSSKDQITCFDGARKNEMEGKGQLSNSTNASIFQFLNQSNMRTHFRESVSRNECIVERCEMIPIEFVARRLVTGSYLRRNPGVEEGFRFPTPKVEYFLKDDKNNDPQWSREQILEAKMIMGGITIGAHELDELHESTLACFEILERAWLSRGCVLVDMKVEFGVSLRTQEILLADVIDNDSWRLWQAGDKRLMKDKQVYRNLKEITNTAMIEIKKNYTWVANEANLLLSKSSARVVIFMGSPSDETHCKKISLVLESLNIMCELRISSAHKSTEETLQLLRFYESHGIPTVFIAVAGRSNGLGPVLAGNTSYPVINCPPVQADWGKEDVWSSLRLPSGLGCTTTIHSEGAAIAAAQILGLTDHVVWCKLRGKRLQNLITLLHADKRLKA